METDVDRVLVYVTLYIIECLKRLQKLPNVERATQDMFSAALEPFSIPGEAGFPLNAFYSKPQGSEAEEMKKYLVQVRGHILMSSYLVITYSAAETRDRGQAGREGVWSLPVWWSWASQVVDMLG